MSLMRKHVWADNGIKRDSLTDVDKELYMNHTYVKKFKALGFTYDSESESKYLLYLPGEAKENEYTINEAGEFVPGITEKNKVKKLG